MNVPRTKESYKTCYFMLYIHVQCQDIPPWHTTFQLYNFLKRRGALCDVTLHTVFPLQTTKTQYPGSSDWDIIILTCLHVYLVCRPAHLSARLFIWLPARLPSHQITSLPSSLPTCSPVSTLTCLLTFPAAHTCVSPHFSSLPGPFLLFSQHPQGLHLLPLSHFLLPHLPIPTYIYFHFPHFTTPRQPSVPHFTH